MADGHVSRRSSFAGLDCDVVIARANVRMCNRNVGGRGGIDAVGVACGCRRIDLDAPGGEAVSLAHDYVKIRRVAKCDSIQGEIIRGVNHQESKAILLRILHLGLLSEIPPCDSLMQQAFATLTVNRA